MITALLLQRPLRKLHRISLQIKSLYWTPQGPVRQIQPLHRQACPKFAVGVSCRNISCLYVTSISFRPQEFGKEDYLKDS